MRSVRIHYTRPGHGTQIYEQVVVAEQTAAIVTLAEGLRIREPKTHGGALIMEPGSHIVWHTFPNLWHDIGRVYTNAGEETGIYANVLTPVDIQGGTWRTTDLYLDVWQAVGREAVVLDEDELAEAVEAGAITPTHADRALREALDLLERARAGTWPPLSVREWTLARARSVVRPRDLD